MNLKPQTVYISISTKVRLPHEDGYYFTIHPNLHSGSIESANEFFDGNFYLDSDNGFPSSIEKTSHWLEKKENQICLSKEELVELLEEAFDSGCLLEEYDSHIEKIGNNSNWESEIPPLKKDFINNLFNQ